MTSYPYKMILNRNLEDSSQLYPLIVGPLGLEFDARVGLKQFSRKRCLLLWLCTILRGLNEELCNLISITRSCLNQLNLLLNRCNY